MRLVRGRAEVSVLTTTKLTPDKAAPQGLSLRKKAVFLGANAVVGFALVELVARCLLPAPLEWKEHPSRFLKPDAARGWSLIPGAQDFTVDKPVSVNQDGFRDRDFTVEKPAGTFRIACVGDSYTFGWGVNVEDSFPKQLEQSLGKKRPVEVLNFGVMGYNADQCRVTLEQVALKYQPDLVIYSFYWDDLLPVRHDPKTSPAAIKDESGSPLRRALRSSRAVFAAVQELKTLGGTLFPPRTRFYRCYNALLEGDGDAFSDLWEEEVRQICLMREDAAKIGAKLVVIAWPLEAQALGVAPQCHFEKQAARACGAAGVPCIPLLEPLRNLAKEGKNPYLPYEQHPTPEGYARSVAVIERALVDQGLIP